MAFVSKDDVKRLGEGSLEAQRDEVEKAVRAVAGEDYEVLATWPGKALCCSDAGAATAILDRTDGVLKITSITVLASWEMPVYADDKTDAFVARQLSAVAEAVLNGEPDEETRNRFRALVPLLKREGMYWLSDYEKRLSETEQSDAVWSTFYKTHRKVVREKLRGRVTKIESEVPSKRFGGVPSSDLPARSDLLGSMQRIVELTETLISASEAPVKPHAFDFGIKLEVVAESVKEELGTLKAVSEAAIQLNRERDLPVIANVHDRLADRLKDVSVLTRFLRDTGD